MPFDNFPGSDAIVEKPAVPLQKLQLGLDQRLNEAGRQPVSSCGQLFSSSFKIGSQAFAKLRTRYGDRSEVLVEGGEVGSKFGDVFFGNGTAPDQMIEHPVCGQAPHEYERIDSQSAAATQLKVSFFVECQRNNTKVDIPGQSPIEPNLPCTIKPASFGCAEIQIFIAHGFFELPGMFVRQEDPRHVRLNGFHLLGALRIRCRPAKECDSFFDGPIASYHPISRYAVDGFRQDHGSKAQHEDHLFRINLDPLVGSSMAFREEHAGRLANELADFVNVVFTYNHDHPVFGRNGL